METLNKIMQSKINRNENDYEMILAHNWSHFT